MLLAYHIDFADPDATLAKLAEIGPMPKDTFVVTPLADTWLVSCSDRSFRATYPTRGEAVEAAVLAAHRSGQDGNDANVMGLSAKNELYPIWTYGIDALAVSSRPALKAAKP